jgi:leucyl-tRNA synthetase
MELLNSAGKDGISLKSKKILAQIIAPLAPHLAEEIWEKLGEEFSIFNSDWPKPDRKYLTAQTFELVMQVNGKVRARITAKMGISKEEAIELAIKQPGIDAHLKGKKRIKEIFVPDRLLNIVVGE